MKITALVNRHKTLTKTVSMSADRQYSITPTDGAMWFEAAVIELPSAKQLIRKLVDLQSEPHAMLVRGGLRGGVDLSAPIRRRLHVQDEDPNEAPFLDQAINWMMVDIDKLVLPPKIDLITSPEDAVKFAISQLPREFHNASVFWHLSSSAGVRSPGTISVHLNYWLHEPKTSYELREWAKALNSSLGKKLIDPALYNPVQPHYTADPIFIGDAIDPLKGRRSGHIPGIADAVRLPHIAATQNKARQAIYASPAATHGYEQILASLGDDGAGFNLPLLRACASFVATVGGQEASEQKEVVKADLRRRIQEANSESHDLAELARYSSDSYLDSLIDSAIAKYGEQNRLPTHFDKKEVSLGEGEALLEQAIKLFGEKVMSHQKDIDAFLDDAPTLAIKATAGLGKTTQIIRKLIHAHLNQIGDIHYYVPTHSLMRQLENDLNEVLTIHVETSSFIRTDTISGRDRKTKDGEVLCKKSSLAKRIGQAGLNVSTTLCKNGTKECEFYKTCGYQKQFPGRDSKREFIKRIPPGAAPLLNSVQILTHSHLYLNSKSRLPEPALVVIDESFWRGAIEEILISPTDLSRTGTPSAKLIYEALMLDPAPPLLKVLREKEVHPHDLREEANLIEARLDIKKHPNPSMSERQVSETLTRFSETIKTPQVLRQLADELEITSRDESHTVRYEPKEINTANEKKDKIILSRRKPLLISPGTPVLFIDANANVEILKLFRQNVEIVDIPVERRASIHQFTDRTFSKLSLNPTERDNRLRRQVVDFINRISKFSRTLVVCTKEIKERLEQEVHYHRGLLGGKLVAFTHFGNLRGLNKYGTFDRVVVIGREQPAANGIEDQARALWWDSGIPIYALPSKNGSKPLLETHRTYRGGSHGAVMVQVHPDLRVQTLLEQAREAESEQAIDRLRLLRGPKKRQRDVFILSNVPLDVTIGHHHQWDRMQSVLLLWELAGGIVPLNAKDLMTGYNHLTGGLSNTKILINAIKRSQLLIDLIISDTDLCLRKYRPKHSKLKWSEVLCSVQTTDQEVLQSLSWVTKQSVELDPRLFPLTND